MASVGVERTTAALRYEIYQYLVVFAATVHSAADEIVSTETDREIREMAIRWKITSVPTMQSAVFQLDPLAGLVEAWSIAAQMELFFTTGNGKELFGHSQHIAVNASRELHSEVRALAQSVIPAERLRVVEPRLRAWLDENPITDIFFGRHSVSGEAATITAAEWGTGGLQSVGQIEELVHDLSDRMTIYGAQIPELARSHSELLAIQVDGNIVDPVRQSIDGIAKSIGSEARKMMTFLDGTPDLIASERAVIIEEIQNELETALNDVDRQRVATLAALSGERLSIFEDVDTLRTVLVEDVQSARVAATTDLEALVERQAEAIVLEAESLIDMFFWRALVLLVIGLVGLAVVLRFSRRASA